MDNLETEAGREPLVPSEFARRTGLVLRWIVGLAAAAYLVCALAQMGGRVAYPYQLDYAEPALLQHAAALARGGPQYRASTELPWIANVYGPVYMSLWAALLPLGSPTSFLMGRLLAVAGLLLAVVCLVLLVRSHSRQWWAPLVAASIFLWLPPVRMWTALARVDTLAVGLSVAGLTVFVLGSPRARIWGTLLFVLAVATKQTVIAAPLAAYVALFLQGERRSAAQHLALFFGLILAGVLALQVTSHGAFLRDTVLAHTSQWDWHLAHTRYRAFLMNGPVLVGVGVGLALAGLADRRYRALGLYLLLSLAVAGTVGKIGAGANYFVEPALAAAVLLGVALGAYTRPRSGSALNATLLPALALLQLVVIWMPPALSPPRAQRETESRFAAIVRAQRGEVLSDHMGAQVQAGKTLWVEPWFVAQMAMGGRWDQQPLLQMLRERKFSLVAMEKWQDLDLAEEWWSEDRWSPEVIRAIRENYHVSQVLVPLAPPMKGLVLLVPNAGPPAPARAGS